jgi:hypothetical protein
VAAVLDRDDAVALANDGANSPATDRVVDGAASAVKQDEGRAVWRPELSSTA